MSSAGSLTLRIPDLRSPDGQQRDEAARVIWEHFEVRLRSLVRRRLHNRIRRREDEQDILQSMYASFCHGQLLGKASPASREELWKLLVRITLCKVVNTANRHQAGRRDIRREQTGIEPTVASGPCLRWVVDYVDNAQPSPEEKLIAAEELDRLLHSLPNDLRRIVLFKLDGFSNADIASMIGRTVRCVELKLQLIRKRLASIAEPQG